MIVVFEGYDNTGKTTMIKELKKRLSKEFNVGVHTFNHRPLQEYKNKYPNGYTKLMIDLAGAVEQNSKLTKMLYIKECDIILVDRWVMSAFAYYHKYMLFDMDLIDLYQFIISSLERPDVFIYMKKHTTAPSDEELHITAAYDTLFVNEHPEDFHEIVNNTSIGYLGDQIESIIRKKYNELHGQTSRKES